MAKHKKRRSDSTVTGIFKIIGKALTAPSKWAAGQPVNAQLSLKESLLGYDAVKFRNESLTCSKCGSLAGPIVGTRDRYRCQKCGKQFKAAKHSFGS